MSTGGSVKRKLADAFDSGSTEESKKKSKSEASTNLVNRLNRQRTKRLYELSSLETEHLSPLDEKDRQSLVHTQPGILLLNEVRKTASATFGLVNLESSLCIVDYSTFQRRFDILTCSIFKHFDLKAHNLIVAGGSISACLRHFEGTDAVWFKNVVRGIYDNTDIDLFFCSGQTGSAAIKRCRQTIAAFLHYLRDLDNVRDKAGYYWNFNDAQLILTDNTLTIRPFRTRFYDSDDEAWSIGPWLPNLQIVLHMYMSPYEVLESFDVQCCAVAYDSHAVFLHEKAIRSYLTRCNIYENERYSDCYTKRLIKYAGRGYAIFVPGINWDVVNKQLFTLQERHDALVGSAAFYSRCKDEFVVAKLLLADNHVSKSGQQYQIFTFSPRTMVTEQSYRDGESKRQNLGELCKLPLDYVETIPLWPGPIPRKPKTVALQWRFAHKDTSEGESVILLKYLQRRPLGSCKSKLLNSPSNVLFHTVSFLSGRDIARISRVSRQATIAFSEYTVQMPVLRCSTKPNQNESKECKKNHITSVSEWLSHAAKITAIPVAPSVKASWLWNQCIINEFFRRFAPMTLARPLNLEHMITGFKNGTDSLRDVHACFTTLTTPYYSSRHHQSGVFDVLRQKIVRFNPWYNRAFMMADKYRALGPVVVNRRSVWEYDSKSQQWACLYPVVDKEDLGKNASSGPALNSRCLHAACYSDNDILLVTYNATEDLSLWRFSFTAASWQEYPLTKHGLDWKYHPHLPYDCSPNAFCVGSETIYVLVPMPNSSPVLWQLSITLIASDKLEISMKSVQTGASSEKCSKALERCCSQVQPSFVFGGRLIVMLSYEELLAFNISESTWHLLPADLRTAIPDIVKPQYDDLTIVNWQDDPDSLIHCCSDAVLPRRTKLFKGRCWLIGSTVLALDRKLYYNKLDLDQRPLQWQSAMTSLNYMHQLVQAKRTLLLGDRMEAYNVERPMFSTISFWAPRLPRV